MLQEPVKALEQAKLATVGDPSLVSAWQCLGVAKPSGGGGEAKPQEPTPPQPAAAASLSCTVCGQTRNTHSCSGCKREGVPEADRSRYCCKECQVHGLLLLLSLVAETLLMTLPSLSVGGALEARRAPGELPGQPVRGSGGRRRSSTSSEEMKR